MESESFVSDSVPTNPLNSLIKKYANCLIEITKHVESVALKNNKLIRVDNVKIKYEENGTSDLDIVEHNIKLKEDPDLECSLHKAVIQLKQNITELVKIAKIHGIIIIFNPKQKTSNLYIALNEYTKTLIMSYLTVNAIDLVELILNAISFIKHSESTENLKKKFNRIYKEITSLPNRPEIKNLLSNDDDFSTRQIECTNAYNYLSDKLEILNKYAAKFNKAFRKRPPNIELVKIDKNVILIPEVEKTNDSSQTPEIETTNNSSKTPENKKIRDSHKKKEIIENNDEVIETINLTDKHEINSDDKKSRKLNKEIIKSNGQKDDLIEVINLEDNHNFSFKSQSKLKRKNIDSDSKITDKQNEIEQSPKNAKRKRKLSIKNVNESSDIVSQSENLNNSIIDITSEKENKQTEKKNKQSRKENKQSEEENKHNEKENKQKNSQQSKLNLSQSIKRKGSKNRNESENILNNSVIELTSEKENIESDNDQTTINHSQSIKRKRKRSENLNVSSDVTKNSEKLVDNSFIELTSEKESDSDQSTINRSQSIKGKRKLSKNLNESSDEARNSEKLVDNSFIELTSEKENKESDQSIIKLNRKYSKESNEILVARKSKNTKIELNEIKNRQNETEQSSINQMERRSQKHSKNLNESSEIINVNKKENKQLASTESKKSNSTKKSISKLSIENESKITQNLNKVSSDESVIELSDTEIIKETNSTQKSKGRKKSLEKSPNKSTINEKLNANIEQILNAKKRNFDKLFDSHYDESIQITNHKKPKKKRKSSQRIISDSDSPKVKRKTGPRTSIINSSIFKSDEENEKDPTPADMLSTIASKEIPLEYENSKVDDLLKVINDNNLDECEQYLYMQEVLQFSREKYFISDTLKEKLQNLKIKIDWEIPEAHKIGKISTNLKKSEKEKLASLGVNFGDGYTLKETNIIKENWREFCEKYNFDTKDAYPFMTPSGRKDKIFSLVERTNFVLFIGKGLPNKCLRSIYVRFKNIFKYGTFKTSKFTPEEDQLVMYYLKKYKEKSSYRKYVRLEPLLNRERTQIERRHRYLKKMHNDVKVHWNVELKTIFVNHILDEINSKDINDLRDAKLDKQIFLNISQKMNIPFIKLYQKWITAIYTELFAEKPIYIHIIKVKLVKRLVKIGTTDWAKIEWDKVCPKFKGFNRRYLWNVLQDVVRYNIPRRKMADLKECLDLLKEHYVPFIKKRPEYYKRVRYRLRYTENRTLEPYI